MALIYGDNGNNNIPGTANDDQIFARAGNDFVFGRGGNDLILGEAGNDALSGEGGNDTLRGGDNVDYLSGGAGNDILNGGGGSDTFLGGIGNDRFVWNNSDGSDTIRGDAGTDVVEVNGSTTAGDNFILNRGGVQLIFRRTNLTQFNLDVAGVEQFEVNAGGGNDRFEVRDVSGTDVNLVTFSGGAGNDTLAGIDTAQRLVGFGGGGNDTFFGGTNNDSLFGGNGDDNLIGGSGNDRLNGQAGNDTLVGNAGSDLFVFNSGAAFRAADVGIDTIEDFTVGVDKIILDRTTFRALPGSGQIVVDNVDNDDDAATSSAIVTYSLGTGNLFYNQDGADAGFGRTGGQFATLTGAPSVLDADFVTQA